MLSPNDPVTKLRLVGPSSREGLRRLGITTVQDLLYHFPREWQDLSRLQTIAEIRPAEHVNLKAGIKKISQFRSPKKRLHITQALLEDETGNIIATWFNQPFLKNSLLTGREYYFSGKASQPGGSPSDRQLQNPAFELVKTDTIHTAGIIPIYDLTEGITQKQIRYWLKQSLDAIPPIDDHLPSAMLKRLRLPGLKTALAEIHFPATWQTLEAARSRLAFDELFLLQLALLSYKKKLQSVAAPRFAFNQPLVKKFVASLPFALTPSQRLSAWEILRDLSKKHPMNRLLEGDVGSGKTVVAGIAMLEVASAGFQSILLAPTEILAWQHYQTLKELYQDTKLDVALLTRSHKITPSQSPPHEGEKKESIIVGTHALLQEHVRFERIGLLVVDEQHRFGVKQRQALLRRQTQTETQTDASIKFLYRDLTYKIRSSLFEVKKKLGLGHKEIIYQKALAEELQNAGLDFEREKFMDILYDGKKIGVYQPDFVIEDKIIVELKALPFIGNTERRQIWTYLKGSRYSLALLVNFSPIGVEIIRIVYDTARQGPRKSASSQRQSAKMVPHLLSMTATPIPRTLALAFYGDLDISELRELPSGRKPVITRMVNPQNRSAAHEFIRREITLGRQAYVVTPLIEESDKLGVKSATAEADRLKKTFSEFHIGLLHGRIPAEEKKKIMDDFLENRIHILVSTTVIEVGIDCPNATIMVIENAERFGLSQLHQLRGRVGRGAHQSYCLLFSEGFSDLTQKRLMAVVESTDGFKLAEADLRLRGPGEIMGIRQSGYVPFKIARLSDHGLIRAAKTEAEKLLDADPKLAAQPRLRAKIKTLASEAHLE